MGDGRREWTLNIYWNYSQHDLLIKGGYNYEERDISDFELSSWMDGGVIFQDGEDRETT